MKLVTICRMATTVVAVSTLSAAFASSPGAQGNQDGQQRPAEKDVVQLVMADKNLTTLVEAVKAADLVSALKDARSITVFAPTDEAFKALPEEQLKSLLQDKEALKKVLLHHTVGARLYRNTIMNVTGARMLDGSTTEFSMSADAWKIEDSIISKSSMKASNGIVYTIDKILMPE